MSTTLCKTTEPELALQSEPARPLRTMQVAELYATAPMEAIRPVVIANIASSTNEELLHASFEEAISDRVTALHSRLDRLQLRTTLTRASTGPLTGPISTVQETPNAACSACHGPITEPLQEPGNAAPSYTEEQRPLRDSILLICSALILFMAGFDTTALLFLHTLR